MIRIEKENNTGRITNIPAISPVMRCSMEDSFKSLILNKMEEKEELLAVIGLSDGGNISICKDMEYNRHAPCYRVKCESINEPPVNEVLFVEQVMPENANYIEMVAYTTYLDREKKIEHALKYFLKAAEGTDYTMQTIHMKKNYKIMFQQFMQLQFECNDLNTYLSCKRLYEYWEERTYEISKSSHKGNASRPKCMPGWR